MSPITSAPISFRPTVIPAWTYSCNAYIQGQEIENELRQLDKERDAARACGYDFVVGVSTDAHRVGLLNRERTFNIVVTGCKR